MVPSDRILLDEGHRSAKPGRGNGTRNDMYGGDLSLNLEQKQAVVAEVAKQVAGAQAIVMVENRGMAVADMTQLRAKARASGVYFRVVKNTLVRRAVAEYAVRPAGRQDGRSAGVRHRRRPRRRGEGPERLRQGQREVRDHGRRDARPGDVAKEIAALAALPSRDELIAKLMGTMQAPIAKFVRTLNEVPSKFVRTLAAVRDAKPAA